METLEIVVGLIFIYLLLSLLGTTVQELWAGLTSLRGKVLLKGVIKLLEIENIATEEGAAKRKVLEDFKQRIIDSKVYQKYSSKYLWLQQLPSYLSAEQIAAVIQELMETDTPTAYQDRSTAGSGQPKVGMSTVLSHIRQDDLRQQLSIIYQATRRTAPGVTDRSASTDMPSELSWEEEISVENAKNVFKKHYDEIMARATGWYKRTVQTNLIVFGFLIALAFDADTFKIYSNLTAYPNDRQKLIEVATQFANNNRVQAYSVAPASTPDSGEVAPAETASLERVSKLRSLLDSLLSNEIQRVPSPLGLGWQQSLLQQAEESARQGRANWLFYILKFCGWIVTALAISMGAPFWFDLLQKVVNIRNAGARPQDPPRK